MPHLRLTAPPRGMGEDDPRQVRIQLGGVVDGRPKTAGKARLNLEPARGKAQGVKRQRLMSIQRLGQGGDAVVRSDVAADQSSTAPPST
jgi:hypothetical protein